MFSIDSSNEFSQSKQGFTVNLHVIFIFLQITAAPQYTLLIDDDDEVVTAKANFKPLLLETMTKDFNESVSIMITEMWYTISYYQDLSDVHLKQKQKEDKFNF